MYKKRISFMCADIGYIIILSENQQPFHYQLQEHYHHQPGSSAVRYRRYLHKWEKITLLITCPHYILYSPSQSTMKQFYRRKKNRNLIQFECEKKDSLTIQPPCLSLYRADWSVVGLLALNMVIVIFKFIFPLSSSFLVQMLTAFSLK